MPEWKSLPPAAQDFIVKEVEKVVHEYATHHDYLVKTAIGFGTVAIIVLAVFSFITWRKLKKLSTEQKKLEGEVRLNEVTARNAELQFLKEVQEAKELCSTAERELEATIIEMMSEMDKNNKAGVTTSREKGLGIFAREYSSSYAHYVEVKSLQVTGKKEAARGFINGSIIPWLNASASVLEKFNADFIVKPLKVTPYPLQPYFFSDVFGFLDAHLDPAWIDESKGIEGAKVRLQKWVSRP